MSWSHSRGKWHHASGATVQVAGDGVRWMATIGGRNCVPAGAPHRLLTWETADGARAHVERELRRRRVTAGNVFAGGECERCGFVDCACLKRLRDGELYDDLDQEDDDER